jgi:hypothetical protein
MAFIVVNTTFAALFLRRPIWLIWPYALLVLQIYQGHGLGAWTLWRRETQIDWVSVMTVLAATLGLVLVIADRMDRRQAREPHPVV